MGFQICTHADPFTKRVREVYRANVVRAPRVGLDPYRVLAVSDDHVENMGMLEHLLVDGKAYRLPKPRAAAAADLTGLRSTTLKADVALGLTTAFLQALGVPPVAAASISTGAENLDRLAFEVHDVTELAVDLGEVGNVLKGAVVDRRNPSAAVFFDDADVKMHIVTRVLKSRSFRVHASDTTEASAGLRTSGLMKLLGDVSGGVKSVRQDDGDIIFTGPEAATFAISTVLCNLDISGRFSFGLALGGFNYLNPGSGPGELLVEHQPIIEDDGILDLEATGGVL